MHLPAHYCLLFTLFAMLPMAAQESSGKQRTCRIIYLNAPSGAPEKLHLFDGKVSQEVELPRMNLSAPYALPPGRIRLRMLTEPVTDPNKLPKEAPAVSVAATVRDCYLLVTTDRQNTVAPVHLQLIDAKADRFGKGQIIWYNLSPHTLKGEVGNQKLWLPPQSQTIMKSPASKRERYAVDLSFFIADDIRPHPLCETSWLHDPRSRMVAFVFMEKNRRTPRVLSFTDLRRSSAEKPRQ